ncbi:MAG TPA: SDR family oxidoreductase [Dongiaceae bacterium]|nr:SDR family oxidoreductase [Dongiaceae bacterium]
MNIDLSGKTAIVTGSSAGIGLAIARGLAASGARVVVNGRDQDSVDKAIAKLRAVLPAAKLEGVAADVGTAEGCARLAAALPAADMLVNNAGIYELKDFFAIADADWQRLFEINVLSGIRLSRALMPGMLKRNWGRIVFISSESGIHIPPEMIHYGMTKTAQLAISRGLAELTAGTGVTVNAVLPGPTRTEGVEDLIETVAAKRGVSVDQAAKEFVTQSRPTSLLRRLASPEEVANMVVYTCSKEASATNGAALRVEGGILRGVG